MTIYEKLPPNEIDDSCFHCFRHNLSLLAFWYATCTGALMQLTSGTLVDRHSAYNTHKNTLRCGFDFSVVFVVNRICFFNAISCARCTPKESHALTNPLKHVPWTKNGYGSLTGYQASELCVPPPHLWWGVQCGHTGHVELFK
jgi:hypothetical protein